MKIAIIGATGFVGSHLLKEALNRSHQVTAIVRDTAAIKLNNPNLYVQQGDVSKQEELAGLLAGHEVVLSAFNAGWNTPHLYEHYIAGSESIQSAIKKAGVKRLLVVGGAGSLEVAPGVQLVDTPSFPEQYKQGASASRDYLNLLRQETDLDWTFLSPAILMHPGTSGIRTGKYRTGTNQPVFNEQGESRISVEDLAVALLDEAEQNQFMRQRFTIGY
jgi:putative NADH-flavin reductase